MTPRRIRWTERALRRLDKICHCVEKDDPNAATREVARRVASVDMFAELPTAGRIGRITGTREVVCPTFATSSLSGSPGHRDHYGDAHLSEMAENAVKVVCLLGRTPVESKLQSP